MRLVLLFITVILFILNYPICDLFYPGEDELSIDKWNMLNVDIDRLVIVLAFLNLELYIQYLEINKWYKFFVYLGVGFTSADVIDRWIFHQRKFILITDCIMIILVLIYGYRKHLKNKHG